MKSQLWWYTARAGGIVAWALLAISVVWGLLLSSRMLGRRISGPKLLDLHRFVGGLAVVFTGVHVVGLVLDRFVDFGLVDLLVPMASSHEPGAVAWGVVAMYLLVAVEVTSLLRRRVGERFWRRVHYLSFGAFVLSTVHALALPGTDIENPAIWWPSAIGAAAVVGLAVARVVASGNPMRRVATDSDAVALEREVERREREITEQLRGDGERPDAALIERTLHGLRALDDRPVGRLGAFDVPPGNPAEPGEWTMPVLPPARPGARPIVAEADLAPHGAGHAGPSGPAPQAHGAGHAGPSVPAPDAPLFAPPAVPPRPAPAPVAPIFAPPRVSQSPPTEGATIPAAFVPPEVPAPDAAVPPFVAPTFDPPIPAAFTPPAVPVEDPAPPLSTTQATSGSLVGHPRDASLSWLAPEPVPPIAPPAPPADLPVVEGWGATPPLTPPRASVLLARPPLDDRPLPPRELPVRTPRRLARTTAAAERLDAWTPTRVTSVATVPVAPPAPPDAVDPTTGEPDAVAYRQWLKDWLAYVESQG